MLNTYYLIIIYIYTYIYIYIYIYKQKTKIKDVIIETYLSSLEEKLLDVDIPKDKFNV